MQVFHSLKARDFDKNKDFKQKSVKKWKCRAESINTAREIECSQGVFGLWAGDEGVGEVATAVGCSVKGVNSKVEAQS